METDKQQQTDKQQVNLLAIFHYVLGGISALVSCIALIHITLGILIVSGAMSGGRGGPPKALGLIFIIIPGLLMLCGWTLAVCMIVAGRRLARFRSRTYCLVIAGIECLMMPLGTVLGIFTIIVLMRDSVRQLFEGSGAPAAAVPASPPPS